MPPLLPHTFDFDNTASSPTGTGGGSVFSFTIPMSDDGVDFTWSLTSQFSDGANQTGYFPSASSGYFYGTASSGASDSWVLEAVGGTGTSAQTQFFGTASNPISLAFNWVGGVWLYTFVGTAGNVLGTLTTGATAVTAVGQFTSVMFTPTASGNSLYIDSLTATINCFLEGTRIAAPHGEVAVEALSPGDVITTADGGTTTVKWVGQQEIATRFVMPKKVNPICIKAGALAEGVPSRNLYMTGDHALLIDGLLINASCLTNGRSIYQVEKMPLDGFSYYHVETDAHELLVAEGVAAETFIDYVGRDTFQNADEHSEMYPDLAPIAEMDLPRISAKRLVPDKIIAALRNRADSTQPFNRRVKSA